jgi:hypothetical protein
MTLANGERLQEAAVAQVESWLRRDAPGNGIVTQEWRPNLKSDGRTAFLGVLLTLARNVQDLSMAIFTAMGHPRRSTQPLEYLFGLGIGHLEHEDHLEPRPQLSLLPHLCNITRLRTYGANLALLCLGFDNLETLEVDFSQPFSDASGWHDEVVEFQPFSLQKVTSLVLHTAWEAITGSHIFGTFFDHIKFPALVQAHVNIVVSHDLGIGYTPMGSFHYLFRALRYYSIDPQELRITVDNDCEKSNRFASRRFEPFDLQDACLGQLHQLHTLCVPAAALVEHSARHHDTPGLVALSLSDLPPNLKHLEILYPNAAALKWLQDTFSTVASNDHGLLTLTLLCDWKWGKPRAWFDRRRAELDGLPFRVIVDIAQDQEEPAGYIDPEDNEVWTMKSADGNRLRALFRED